MKRVVVYGAGFTAEKIIPQFQDKYEIFSVVDSDEKKWGGVY